MNEDDTQPSRYGNMMRLNECDSRCGEYDRWECLSTAKECRSWTVPDAKGKRVWNDWSGGRGYEDDPGSVSVGQDGHVDPKK
jgi:hypothetical protein